MEQARVNEIYDHLTTLVVELDSNPAALGPAYLQDLISKVRGYLNQVSVFMQETLRERHELEDDLARKEAAFEIRANGLLTEDARVTRLPNIDDRKAMINVILSDDRAAILDLGVDIRNLTAVEKVVKHRQRELERTMSEIRLQRSLIQSELKTGSFYGDETEDGREATWGRQPAKDPINQTELDRLMAEADEELVEGVEEADEEADDPSASEAMSVDMDVIDEPSPEQPKGNGKSEPAPADDVVEDPDIAAFLDGSEDFDDLFEDM